MKRRIVVVEDTTYEARFKPIVYELSLYSSDESMGSVDGSGSYEYGSDIEIAAVPEKGYRFDSWSDGDTVALRTYRIKASTNLVANFVPIEYEVRLSVNDSYYGTVEGAGLYSYQSDAELVEADFTEADSKVEADLVEETTDAEVDNTAVVETEAVAE